MYTWYLVGDRYLVAGGLRFFLVGLLIVGFSLRFVPKQGFPTPPTNANKRQQTPDPNNGRVNERKQAGQHIQGAHRSSWAGFESSASLRVDKRGKCVPHVFPSETPRAAHEEPIAAPPHAGDTSCGFIGDATTPVSIVV